MEKPPIFIGSSEKESSTNAAYAIQKNIEGDTTPTVWTQGIFTPNKSKLESLITALDSFKFGIVVFSFEDSQDGSAPTFSQSTQINIVFILGLLMGKFGKDRTFIIIPKGDFNVNLDFGDFSVSPETYDSKRTDNNLEAALGPACNRIINVVKALSTSPSSADALRTETTPNSLDLEDPSIDQIKEPRSSSSPPNLFRDDLVSLNEDEEYLLLTIARSRNFAMIREDIIDRNKESAGQGTLDKIETALLRLTLKGLIATENSMLEPVFITETGWARIRKDTYLLSKLMTKA